MSTQLAQIELAQPVASGITPLRGPEGDILDADMPESGNPTSVARGIASAVLIATPFWALFAFALYLLI
jgi:hypothetical protein